MPNTFGIAGSELAVRLFDPRMLRRLRDRFAREPLPGLALANSLYVPGGDSPARGFLLLRRRDLDAFPSKYATNFQLSVEDTKAGPAGSSKLTFHNLAVVQARCVTTGLASDAEAIYLVEVTDGRGVLKNRWFEFGLNAQYNVPAPAYPNQYYQDSLNGGAAWTWPAMVENLWSKMAAFLGGFPGLPAPPSGTPVNWIFPGVCAWEALCRVLDYLGFAVAVDLTQNAPYTIVDCGAADAAFEGDRAKHRPLLLDDAEWVDVGAARIPAEVVVYFHKKYEFYGTEETVRRDSLQWSTTPLFQVAVPAPAVFTGAAGTHFLWSDFSVRVDVDGSPLAGDLATAATVAASTAAAYYKRAYRSTKGYLHQLYAGALPFATGSQVDGVCWRQDFRPPHDRQGWLTEIISGDDPPWAICREGP
jgi:hypothetical protein